MAVDGFGALQFALKVLAEIRTTTFYKPFCPLIVPIRTSTQCHLKYVSV